jgi:hypothetical protein
MLKEVKHRVRIIPRYSIQECLKNTNSLYVFEDNVAEDTTTLESIIRDQPNAHAIPVKYSHSYKYPSSFFHDREEERKLVVDSLDTLLDIYLHDQLKPTIVFHESIHKLGSYTLAESSPKIYMMIKKYFRTHFGIELET